VARLQPEYECGSRMVPVNRERDLIRSWSEAPGFKMLYCFCPDKHMHTFSLGLVPAAELIGVRESHELGVPPQKLIDEHEWRTGRKVTIVRDLDPAAEAEVSQALQAVDDIFERLLTAGQERLAVEFASQLAHMGTRGILEALFRP
jgi:hypothetical protein